MHLICIFSIFLILWNTVGTLFLLFNNETAFLCWQMVCKSLNKYISNTNQKWLCLWKITGSNKKEEGKNEGKQANSSYWAFPYHFPVFKILHKILTLSTSLGSMLMCYCLTVRNRIMGWDWPGFPKTWISLEMLQNFSSFKFLQGYLPKSHFQRGITVLFLCYFCVLLLFLGHFTISWEWYSLWPTGWENVASWQT